MPRIHVIRISTLAMLMAIVGLLLCSSSWASLGPGAAGGKRPAGDAPGTLAARAPTLAKTSAAGEEENEENEEEAEEAEEAEEGAEEEAQETSSESKPKRKRRPPAVLSQLKLAPKSVALLKRHRPAVSGIELIFTLSARAKVHVTLSKQTGAHGRVGWTTTLGPLLIASSAGRNDHRLTERNRLSAGRYMLTLTPARGKPHSIYLSVRA